MAGRPATADAIVDGVCVWFEAQFDDETGALSIKADVTGQAGRADVNVTIGNAGQIIAAQIRARNGS